MTYHVPAPGRKKVLPLDVIITLLIVAVVFVVVVYMLTTAVAGPIISFILKPLEDDDLDEQ